MQETVVVGYARTPIGRFGGGLSTLPAVQLGGHAVTHALERAGVAGADVGYVVMGHVLQAGQGQITARQAAQRGGIPLSVPAETMNKVCPSGMTAVARGASLIALGEFDVVVAGGMESMSGAPYALDRARFGYRLGDGALIDTMMFDGLTCAFDREAMGAATERYQEQERDVSRQAQDEWSARSHERAAAAWKDGAFADEVAPVEVPQRKGDPVVVEQDEGIRPGTTVESLSGLRPAFDRDGTITAGNASQISDGGAALVLMSRSEADRRGLEPLATIRSWGTTAGPLSLLPQPANAIRRAAEKLDADPASFDLYEINEAFASVAMAGTADLGVDEDRVNVRGGAVALGHPIGCTGARLLVTLISALRERGGGRGAAGLCGGGGQGDALVLDVG